MVPNVGGLGRPPDRILMSQSGRLIDRFKLIFHRLAIRALEKASPRFWVDNVSALALFRDIAGLVIHYPDTLEA